MMTITIPFDLAPEVVLGALGILAAAVLVILVRRGLHRSRATDWGALLNGEDGAAYSLSYVMTAPIYLLLVCVIIEAALTMTVKLGTSYAAFAAARSYAVWLPLSGQAEQKAQQAAAQAMTPFAADKGGGGGGGIGSAYRQYAGGEAHSVSSGYVDRKRGYAGGATEVSLYSAPANWDGDVKVTVRYRMPFRIPAIGRILGFGTVLTLESHATVMVEGVKGKSIGEPNPLGIQYDPGEL
jgi:Flp pilus assembly protein TadG